MKKTTVIILTGLILISLIVTGCGGGDTKIQATTRPTTLGQELIDLEKAHKQGVLTEKEYKKAKERLLKGKY